MFEKNSSDFEKSHLQLNITNLNKKPRGEENFEGMGLNNGS